MVKSRDDTAHGLTRQLEFIVDEKGRALDDLPGYQKSRRPLGLRADSSELAHGQTALATL